MQFLLTLFNLLSIIGISFGDQSANKLRKVTSIELTELVSQNKLVLCGVFAEWCGHCKTLHPIFEKVAQNNPSPKDAVIVEIDGQSDQAFMEKFDIKGFPTLLAFKGDYNNAKPVNVRKYEELISFIQEQIVGSSIVYETDDELNDAISKVVKSSENDAGCLVVGYFNKNSSKKQKLVEEMVDEFNELLDSSMRYLLSVKLFVKKTIAPESHLVIYRLLQPGMIDPDDGKSTTYHGKNGKFIRKEIVDIILKYTHRPIRQSWVQPHPPPMQVSIYGILKIGNKDKNKIIEKIYPAAVKLFESKRVVLTFSDNAHASEIWSLYKFPEQDGIAIVFQQGRDDNDYTTRLDTSHKYFLNTDYEDINKISKFLDDAINKKIPKYAASGPLTLNVAPLIELNSENYNSYIQDPKVVACVLQCPYSVDDCDKAKATISQVADKIEKSKSAKGKIIACVIDTDKNDLPDGPPVEEVEYAIYGADKKREQYKGEIDPEQIFATMQDEREFYDEL